MLQSDKVTSIIVRDTSKFNANLTFVYDTTFGGFVNFLRKENMCRMYNGASRHHIYSKNKVNVLIPEIKFSIQDVPYGGPSLSLKTDRC